MLPRYGLWVSGIEVGEQFSVSEMPEPGTIISHGVGWARDVIVTRDITVVPLMERLEPQ